jgi:hypothetical protein
MYGPERTEILIACRNFDPNSDNFAILYDSAVALAKKEAKRRKPIGNLQPKRFLYLNSSIASGWSSLICRCSSGKPQPGHPPAGQNASKVLFRSMAGQFKSPASFVRLGTPVQFESGILVLSRWVCREV